MTPSDLKSARARLGMSASELGLEVGYRGGKRNAGRYIRRIEDGSVNVPPRIALQVCEMLGEVPKQSAA